MPSSGSKSQLSISSVINRLYILLDIYLIFTDFAILVYLYYFCKDFIKVFLLWKNLRKKRSLSQSFFVPYSKLSSPAILVDIFTRHTEKGPDIAYQYIWSFLSATPNYQQPLAKNFHPLLQKLFRFCYSLFTFLWW